MGISVLDTIPALGIEVEYTPSTFENCVLVSLPRYVASHVAEHDEGRVLMVSVFLGVESSEVSVADDLVPLFADGAVLIKFMKSP